MVAPFQPDPDKVRAIREALPATGAGIYLNTGTAGPLPSETLHAMRELEDHEGRVGRGDSAAADAFLERMDEARAVLAALVGGDSAAIALTHGTTDGLNQAVWAPDWRAGDRIVTSDQEHPGLLAPLLAVRERFALDLELVALEEAGAVGDDAVVAAFERAITPRTRLVALSHVTWTTGLVLPVTRIAALAGKVGAWCVVDGAQAAGAVPVDAPHIGADFYAFPGQKWLLGPSGTGGLWASERAQREARQAAAGALSYERLSPDGSGVRRTSARRFEATSFHRPSVVGLARSVGWLEMYVGLGWAHTRAARLARRTADRLVALPSVTLLTPRDRMATLLTFRIAGWTGDEAVDELSSRVFAITCSVAGGAAIRISVAYFNTDEELDRFVEAVAELADHTPGSLPRRPPLVVVRAEE